MKKYFMTFVIILATALSVYAQYDYKTSLNYGKSIAVFGGSFSVIPASNVAKDYWRYLLKCKVEDYGIGGAGFSIKTKAERYIPMQIDKAIASGKKYDIFILWASTNDCSRNVEIKEQNNQIQYCIEKIRKAFPEAKILFFTSMPVPLLQKFVSLHEYVDGQIMVCKKMNVPCLNLYTDSGFNEWNACDFFSDDKLHLNWNGYNHIKETLVNFISLN